MKTSIKTSTSSFSALLVGTLIVAGAFPAAAGAQAAEQKAGPGEFTRIIVSYADLNPDSERGAKVLYARIRLAARTACSSLEGRDLASHAHWKSCFDSAASSAVSQVNKPLVSAIHRALQAQQTPKG